MGDKLEIKFKNGSSIKWLKSNGYTLRGYGNLINLLTEKGEKEDSSLARDNTKEGD